MPPALVHSQPAAGPGAPFAHGCLDAARCRGQASAAPPEAFALMVRAVFIRKGYDPEIFRPRAGPLACVIGI